MFHVKHGFDAVPALEPLESKGEPVARGRPPRRRTGRGGAIKGQTSVRSIPAVLLLIQDTVLRLRLSRQTERSNGPTYAVPEGFLVLRMPFRESSVDRNRHPDITWFESRWSTVFPTSLTIPF